MPTQLPEHLGAHVVAVLGMGDEAVKGDLLKHAFTPSMPGGKLT
jgi:hypothetical protein